MSKSFGKIVFVSTLLAGAAVGAYSYMKKNNMVATEADVEGEASADATAEFTTKNRNYVDLSSTNLSKTFADVKSAVADVAVEVKGAVSDAVVEAGKAISNAKESVAEAVAEAKKSSEVVLDEAEATVEDVVDAVEEKVEAAADAVEEKVESAEAEFEEGLQAEKIEADNVIGSDSSEEFFNDEEA